MTLLREVNNALANAWQEAVAKGQSGKQRQIAALWKAAESLCETEEMKAEASVEEAIAA